MTGFIGREYERSQLETLLMKKTASLVVVYGRRRIGKSRLIENFGKDFNLMTFSGLSPREGIDRQAQLNEFSHQLARYSSSYKHFTDWSDAFFSLSKEIKKGQRVILFDEISWMATEDLDFLGKLKIAWDLYLSKNPKLILVLCGSVSAWIQKNIISSTGFHGRISLKLFLREMKVEDCKYFWGNHEKNVSNHEKLKILAVTGGIPKYLEEINPTISAEDNIRRLAFTESGILFNDFSQIFTDTLQRKSEFYKKIVNLLKNGALETTELTKLMNIKSGGFFNSYLDELTVAGFISKNSTWHIKDGKPSSLSMYRLSDNYLRFYLKYIEPNIEKIISGNFSNTSISSLPGWSSIMSLQVENLVLSNREKIKKTLNILPEDIICDNPFFQRKTNRQQGCQIDYLIQTRHDNLYVCEIKYTRNLIRKDIINELNEKINRLKAPKHFSIRPVLIYSGQLHDEVIDADYFAQTIDLDELF
jgi:AAA+ ATPase superfamily predicted ATPase